MLGGLAPLQTMRQAGVEIVRLPTFELRSEYFGGARGQVLQTAADVGAGVIAGGMAGGARASTQGIATEAQVGSAVRSAGGLRQSPLNVLDDATIQRLRQEFAEIGGDPSILRFNRGSQTAYRDNAVKLLTEIILMSSIFAVTYCLLKVCHTRVQR